MMRSKLNHLIYRHKQRCYQEPYHYHMMCISDICYISDCCDRADCRSKMPPFALKIFLDHSYHLPLLLCGLIVSEVFPPVFENEVSGRISKVKCKKQAGKTCCAKVVDETSTEMVLFVDQIVESARIRRNRRRFSLISSTNRRPAFRQTKTGSLGRPVNCFLFHTVNTHFQ